MDTHPAAFAPALIKLLQGVLYFDDRSHWDLLLKHQTPIRDYFGKIGLELILDEAEGYAFLIQYEGDDPDDPRADLPRLIRRIPLTYDVTLLCVLLRERLQQFDARETDSTRLVVSKDELVEIIRIFFRDRADEVKLLRNLDSVVNKVVDLGFLKKLDVPDQELYEVRRIIKAKITADVLDEIKQKLTERAESDA